VEEAKLDEWSRRRRGSWQRRTGRGDCDHGTAVAAAAIEIPSMVGRFVKINESGDDDAASPLAPIALVVMIIVVACSRGGCRRAGRIVGAVSGASRLWPCWRGLLAVLERHVQPEPASDRAREVGRDGVPAFEPRSKGLRKLVSLLAPAAISSSRRSRLLLFGLGRTNIAFAIERWRTEYAPRDRAMDSTIAEIEALLSTESLAFEIRRSYAAVVDGEALSTRCQSRIR